MPPVSFVAGEAGPWRIVRVDAVRGPALSPAPFLQVLEEAPPQGAAWVLRGVRSNERHIDIGIEYLPAVARRLYHSRDLGEPFDFLTWFEYAAGDATAFDRLVARLRESEEWRYVEREIDLRLAPVE